MRRIAFLERSAYGNQASLFTSSGAAARHFRYEAPAGNIGVNIGVAAPMAYFPFSGWKDSFFGVSTGKAATGRVLHRQEGCGRALGEGTQPEILTNSVIREFSNCVIENSRRTGRASCGCLNHSITKFPNPRSLQRSLFENKDSHDHHSCHSRHDRTGNR